METSSPIPDLPAEGAAPSAKRDHNPGKFEDLSRESRGILSTHELFEGMKCEFARGVNRNFNIMHSINMGSQSDPSSYAFTTTYGDDETGTILVGRVDTEGGKVARFHRNFGRTGLRLNVQESTEGSSGIAEVEYKGRDFTAEAKGATNGFLGLSYTQNVSPNMVAGAECFYYPTQAVSFLSLAGRWLRNGGRSIWNASLSSMGQGSVSYTTKPTDYLSFSSELQAQLTNKLNTQFTVGTEYRVLHGAIMRATVNSNGRVTSLYEESVLPMLRVSLSMELDHPKEQYRFGFGLQCQL